MSERDERGWQEELLGQPAVVVVSQRAALRAAVAPAGSAEDAASTSDDRTYDNAVPWLHMVHRRTHCGDRARYLMPGDDAGLSVFLAAEDADIGMTDGGGGHVE